MFLSNGAVGNSRKREIKYQEARRYQQEEHF